MKLSISAFTASMSESLNYFIYKDFISLSVTSSDIALTVK